MRYFLIFSILVTGMVYGGSATKETIYGDWVSNDAYGRLEGRTKSELLVSEKRITYTIDGSVFDCPIEHFKLINEVFNIRCFSEHGERIHLVLSAHGGGKYAAAFGFEYWKGGLPDEPEAIYGGVPVSFELRNK